MYQNHVIDSVKAGRSCCSRYNPEMSVNFCDHLWTCTCKVVGAVDFKPFCHLVQIRTDFLKEDGYARPTGGLRLHDYLLRYAAPY